MPPRPAHGQPISAPRRASNNVRKLREEQLLTKAELARKAGISPLTVARIESGLDCRVDTKRKIILALGLRPQDRAKVFGGGRSRGGRISVSRAPSARTTPLRRPERLQPGHGRHARPRSS